jgi:hypothetical protein
MLHISDNVTVLSDNVTVLSDNLLISNKLNPVYVTDNLYGAYMKFDCKLGAQKCYGIWLNRQLFSNGQM